MGTCACVHLDLVKQSYFRSLVIWVNEEDHLRIISMEQGGDLGSVFRRYLYSSYWTAVKRLRSVLFEILQLLTCD